MAQRITLNTIGKQGPTGPTGPAGPAGGSDAATAEHVTTGPLTSAALSATIARATIPEVRADSVVSLIGGQADETIVATGCTVTADTTTKRLGTQSWKMSFAGSGSGTAKIAALTTGETLVGHISAVGFMAYIPDPSKVTALTMQVYRDATSVPYYQFSMTAKRLGLAELKAGWNIIRWTPEYGAPINGAPEWDGTIYSVRFAIAVNAAMDINLQQVFAEIRPKASMIFIQDGAETAFDQSPGYNDLRDRGIPVTFAVSCNLVGDPGRMTEERLAELAAENNNSISFHSWDGTSMNSASGATAALAQTHTMRAIKWLSQRGFTGRIWRAAWFQNVGTYSETTNPMVVANPYFGVWGGEKWQNAWPFLDRWNYPRVQVHGKTQAQTDEYFRVLERDRGVFVCYTHEVSDSGNPADATPAEWAYFLSKVDAAIEAGWLEAVTLEMLLARSGNPIRRGMGGALTVDWPNVDGTTERVFLP